MKYKVTQSPKHYYEAYLSNSNILHIFHKKRIDKILALIPRNCKVLDAGCGSGVLSYLMSKNGCEVTGIDIRQECIDFVKSKCNGTFKQANLLALNIDEKFDAVVSSDVLEHFTEDDRAKVVSNLSKHLKAGGKLIVTFPSKLYSTFEPIWKIIRKTIYPNTTFDDEEIHQQIDINKFISLLEQNNLTASFVKNDCFGLITYIVAVKHN